MYYLCKPLSGDGPVLTQKTMFLVPKDLKSLSGAVPEWLALYIDSFLRLFKPHYKQISQRCKQDIIVAAFKHKHDYKPC